MPEITLLVNIAKFLLFFLGFLVLKRLRKPLNFSNNQHDKPDRIDQCFSNTVKKFKKV